MIRWILLAAICVVGAALLYSIQSKSDGGEQIVIVGDIPLAVPKDAMPSHSKAAQGKEIRIDINFDALDLDLNFNSRLRDLGWSDVSVVISEESLIPGERLSGQTLPDWYLENSLRSHFSYESDLYAEEVGGFALLSSISARHVRNFSGIPKDACFFA